MSRQDDIRDKAIKELQAHEVLMLNGHFDFGNGYHGPVYLNPHQLFRHPSTIWRFAQDLLDVLPGAVLDNTEVVAGPVTGGALLAHWPSYVSYILSFVTVGITWVNHHQMFAYITHADHPLLLLNVLLLMAITFVPFPTALIAEYIQQPDQQQVATLVYGAIFTLNALFFNAVWWYAATHHLVKDDLDPAMLRGMMIRYVPGPLLYLIAMLFSFVSAPISIFLYGCMAVFYLIPNSAFRALRPKPMLDAQREE